MITTDLNNGDMTLSALTGSSYIGEHYLNNLSVINGAAVETLDAVFYNTLDITGGFLQTNNVILSGKLNNQNNLFTLFAKFFKNLFHPDNNKYSNRVAKTTGKKDNFERVVLNLEPTQIEPLALSNGEPQRLNETENPDHPVNPVKKTEQASVTLSLPKGLLSNQQFTEGEISTAGVLLASLSSETVLSDAGSAIQLPAIEKKRSDVTLSLPKGLVSNSTNTQRSNATGNLLNPVHPVNPVKDLKNLQYAATPMSNDQLANDKSAPATGGVDPQYTYDIMNNRASMIDPTGTTTYTYDVMERLTSITNQNNETTTFTYDAISRRTSMTYANGVVTTYTYNSDNWLTGMSTNIGATNISSYSYTHDGVGNRLSMTDNDGSHTYTYDDVYRLTNATHPQAYNPTETLTYDPVGNRQTSQISNSYIYDNLNRLNDDDQFTYSYDNNGNMIQKVEKATSANWAYQYDAENRLIQVVTPTDVSAFQYDGFGRRTAKTVNGVITKYVYDRQNILFELDGNDQMKAIYTHGPGVDFPISVDRDTTGDGILDTTYYYHYDGLGSVTAMTDVNGSIVQTYTYDSFGNIVNQTGTVENTFTYTAREWDTEAGLYFYRSRYYDPNIGRFISEDVIKFTGGINFYPYVQNNPVNFTDPEGLGPITLTACAALNLLNVGLTAIDLMEYQEVLEKLDKKLKEIENSCKTDEDLLKRMDEIKNLEKQKYKVTEDVSRSLGKAGTIAIPIQILCALSVLPVTP